MKTFRLACLLAATILFGCSNVPTSQATRDLDVAPVYTQEEKNAMTQEEKVVAYNESMSQDRDKLICRRQEVVGTHFKKTVCKTRGEIEEERKAAQEALGADRGYRFDPTVPNATRPD